MNCAVDRRPGYQRAFSLVEVTVAMGIFFVALFAILRLTGQSLSNARKLEFVEPDIGWVAAELSLTNMVEEGVENGDFGDSYPGWYWTREIRPYPPLEELGADPVSEGLFQVDIALNGPGQSRQTHNLLIFRGGGSQGIGLSRSRQGSSRSRSSRGRTSGSRINSSSRSSRGRTTGRP